MSSISETPIRIFGAGASVFGILRSASSSRKLVLLIPATSGTRIGPQRIYVEIARTLLSSGISSFAVDLPPNGDSTGGNFDDYAGDAAEIVGRYYDTYLELITAYFEKYYCYDQIVLCSISAGCLPVLRFAARKDYNGVMLLSPTQTAENALSYPVHVLAIFGENDRARSTAMAFWSACHFHSYTGKVIDGSDHSFFGWRFKKDVCKTIANWFNEIPV
ncbi:alpha/beta hydrolase [Puia dinghuensis]|uniref:alpha/beta hydrolase n=1 Tax=Puia dinghuensis TaxID=1792502 RepID=UPI00166E0E6D|nr:hypothetical protein [Puia dinghuensis]